MSKRQRRIIHRLAVEGVHYREIAKAAGCHLNTVYRWREREPNGPDA